MRGPGVLLLQSKSLLIEKALAEGEELDAHFLSVIAYSSTVTVSRAHKNSIWLFIFHNVKVLSLKGPGTVYLSPDEQGGERKRPFTVVDIGLIVTFV